MGFLSGKKALIVGLASKRSIAYAIAHAFHAQGAEIALTYQNERLKERVEEMAADFQTRLVYPCDVSSDQEIDSLFKALNQDWKQLDILVHSVAFAPADQIGGDYIEHASREGLSLIHI